MAKGTSFKCIPLVKTKTTGLLLINLARAALWEYYCTYLLHVLSTMDTQGHIEEDWKVFEGDDNVDTIWMVGGRNCSILLILFFLCVGVMDFFNLGLNICVGQNI